MKFKAKITMMMTVMLSVTSLNTWAQQANVNLDYNPQKDTEGLIPFSASLNSPDVHDDNTVTFRLKAPTVGRVQRVFP